MTSEIDFKSEKKERFEREKKKGFMIYLFLLKKNEFRYSTHTRRLLHGTNFFLFFFFFGFSPVFSACRKPKGDLVYK